MTINLNDSIIETSLVITKSIFGNDFSDIYAVKSCWHNIRYLTFSVINYLRINKSINTSYEAITENLLIMYKLKLIPDKLVSFYSKYKDVIDSKLIELIGTNSDILQTVDVTLLYENMLSVDLVVSQNDCSVSIGKISKDITGAYYTPSDLATSVIKEAFRNFESDYFNRNGICRDSVIGTDSKTKDVYRNIRIADLSCGGGEFFKTAQQYLYENYSINFEESALFFWGIDVDPIALQIAICGLLLNSHREQWHIIIGHFILGNPLVDSKDEGTFSEKSDLFGIGRIYASSMGINFEKAFHKTRFDVVVGNPPWEKIRFEERKFFANLYPKISELSQKEKRSLAISKLDKEWPELFKLANEIYDDYKVMNSKSFSHPLIISSVAGELNTYALFTELAFGLTEPNGVCTMIVKSSLVTSPVNAFFWRKLSANGNIHSIFMFENKQKVFNIDSRERFCVITLSHFPVESFSFLAGLQTAKDIQSNKPTKVSQSDLYIVNPFTSMLPNVSKTGDMQKLIEAHNRLPIFEEVYPEAHFGRLLHLTAHSAYIKTRKNEDNLPIYEGKFIEQYDARFSTYASLDDKKKYSSKASATKIVDFGDGKPLPEGRYFIKKSFWQKYLVQYSESYSLCWRSLTSTTNARTTIAMILPTIPMCQSIQMLQYTDETKLLILLGLFNSIPFDYYVRLKMPGIDLTQSVIRQVPVPIDDSYRKTMLYQGIEAKIEEHIMTRIYLVLKEESLLTELLERVDYPIYTFINSSNNHELRKELDYLYARAYGLDEEEFEEIIMGFPKY